MICPTDPSNTSDLSKLLGDYAEALKGLSTAPKLSSYEVLKVLRSRDKIQKILTETADISNNDLFKLVDLDLLLKQHSIVICQSDNLGQFRQNLDPPKSSWWWHLESPLEEPKTEPSSGKFDWVWNVGTVTCLVIATSFITQTAKAFSTEGFDFLGTLSTISQGAGLAFVAGGALTDKGQKRVSHILSSIRIPPSFHAEATFGASLMLLGTSYGINQNLHMVGNWYFERAQKHEDKREWSQAFNSYNRALNFSPDDYKTQISIGFLHERLGNFEQAIEEYKKGSAYGIPEFLNAQARAMLMSALQDNDWQSGIDEAVIREIEGLLNRASASNFDWAKSPGEARRDSQLASDIIINQSIAKIAGIKFQEELDQETQDSLAGVVDQLRSLGTSNQGEEISSLTTASTLGNIRRDCLYWKSFALDSFLDTPKSLGIDYAPLTQDELYYCLQFRFNSKLSSTPDAFLLRNSDFLRISISENLWNDKNIVTIKSGQDFLDLLYGYSLEESWSTDTKNAESQLFLIQSPEEWLILASDISRLIEANYIAPEGEMDDILIWRLLVRKEGEVFAYFAYDEKSREVANIQPFIIEAEKTKVAETIGKQLKDGGKVEFADFKVILSPQGKILHILPWDLAYTTNAARCQEECRNIFLNPSVRAAFKRYKPDLESAAELNALTAVVNINSFSLAVDVSKGINYNEPGIFKLKISSDGQIVTYEAINDVAIKKLGGKIPVVELKLSEFLDFEKPPYADFKLETKGLGARISPWVEDE